MRFAVSRFSKAIVIGVLGFAAAFLVSCGNTNGLLPGDRASSLDSALDGVSAACARGNVSDAQSALARVQRQVDGLSPRAVDRSLITNLQQGVNTLQQLVPDSCKTVTSTTPTQTEVTPPPTQQTTPSTTPQTTPPSTTPTTPGGGTTTPTTPGGGTTTPAQPGGGTPNTEGGNTPDANQGNPGGALAPGQGGSTP